MTLPFTTEQFFRVFADYNRAVWPAQLVLYALGVVLAVLGYRGGSGASRSIALGLALLWAWMGGVYHFGFFQSINPAALVFGAAFLGEALLLAIWGLERRLADAGPARGAAAWVGGALLAYALLVYPLIGWVLGHRYPASPTFGLPCPTTIATLGLLVWVRPAPRWWLLPIPLFWVVVGTTAALRLGMWEDLGLLGAAVIAVVWFWYRARGPSSIAERNPKEVVMAANRQFSTAEAREIGTRLGIDWAEIDLEQLRRGLEVELEHGARDPQTNVTNDDVDLTAKIAWAHLREIRDYYTRLDAMEAAAEPHQP